MSLSESQIRTIVITERVASVLSLCGAFFVIATFALNSKFRKPINRLVFFATWGNVIANVATLISRSGILGGEASSLCQFQAFLIQWFLPADALWTFAMACNVYLSFFRSYDSIALRRLELKYIAACYGVPFLPALIFLFIRSVPRGQVYGSAVLWCWVSLKWDMLRVLTFYGPVWIIILLTIAIYIKVGMVVLRWRKHLLSMEVRPRNTITCEQPASGIRRTYEITVISTNDVGHQPQSHYFPGQKVSFHDNTRSDDRRQNACPNIQRSGGVDPNKATLKYCKCALLFFVALFITWVPSTINRIYTLFKPTDVVFALNFTAALVLPLQGFWNAIVYLATSMFAVRSLCHDIRAWSGGTKNTAESILMQTQAPNLRDAQAVERTLKQCECSYEPDRTSSQSDLVFVGK